MKPTGSIGPERLEKSVEIGTLCAFYGGLLTDKQQDALRLHYEEALGAVRRAEETAKTLRQAQKLIREAAERAPAEAHTGLAEAIEMIGHIIRRQEGD